MPAPHATPRPSRPATPALRARRTGSPGRGSDATWHDARRAGLGIALWFATSAVAVQAATITVNATTDQFGEGPAQCGLREAIQAANSDAAFGGCSAGAGSDLIILPGGASFVLARAGRGEDGNATGDLDITTSVEIRTADASNIADVNAGGIDRVFDVRGGGVILQMARIGLLGGDPVPAGGSADGGLLVVRGGAALIGEALEFYQGRATRGGAVAQADATVACNRCLVRDNTAAGTAGGWVVLPNSDLTLRSSTFARNQAGTTGGALASTGGFVDVLLNNVTIAGNVSNLLNATGRGGGVWFGSLGNPQTIRIHNSVISGNSARGAGSDDCFVSSATIAYSLVGDAVPEGSGAGFCQAQSLATLVQGPARLLPLANYGGALMGLHPAPDSPLRDAGNASAANGQTCFSVDQRGEARGASCDIGALEFVQVFTVNSTGDLVDANPGNGACAAVVTGLCTLRAAVMESNALAGRQTIVVPGQYTLAATGAGEDQGATGDLDILDATNLFGGTQASGIDGNSIDRVLDVHADAAIAQLRLSNGRANGADGGIVRVIGPFGVSVANTRLRLGSALNGAGLAVTNARVLLVGSTVDGGLAGGSGGGIHLGPGSRLDLVASSVVDNQSAAGGGGVHVQSGVLEAHLSTIARNMAGAAGGGVLVGAGASAALSRSLLGDNLRAAAADDCAGTLGGDFNLIGNDGGCTGGGAGSLRNVAAAMLPGLATWGSSGVPMAVPALASPAQYALAGDCVGAGGAPVLVDGLGLPRTTAVAGQRRCTIGAVQSSEHVFGDGFE